ncbi:hypothetical protein BKA56DRAFT_158717 [Ilyonectria sp. MPI-CAGE-AT-0026]|nr:hypothetical protein BKA56DRAFT_158717 [Ilyonectria sp. MPI-CAGE-AT-0026]
MWASNNGIGLDSPTLSRGERSLDHLLTHKDGLTLKYRKLAGVLLAASVFHLSDSPWIDQHLELECISVPSPDNKRLQQWCPRVLCTLMPKSHKRLQSENIAALGVLVLELEADRKASWIAADKDWQSGEKSNYMRLTRILKSWEDLVSDDYRSVAKACLEFDNLIENVEHLEIVSDRKSRAVIYKCILEPLFRHTTKSFRNLAPLFKGMFGRVFSMTWILSSKR